MPGPFPLAMGTGGALVPSYYLPLGARGLCLYGLPWAYMGHYGYLPGPSPCAQGSVHYGDHLGPGVTPLLVAMYPGPLSCRGLWAMGTKGVSCTGGGYLEDHPQDWYLWIDVLRIQDIPDIGSS